MSECNVPGCHNERTCWRGYCSIHDHCTDHALSPEPVTQNPAEMPRLKTLALVSWKRDGDDKMTAHVQNATCDFTYDLIAARSLIGGWNAYLAVNGTLVHTSEHAGRNEAQLEAQAALKRGIDLREGP